MPAIARIAATWGNGARSELEQFLANTRAPGAVLTLFKTADDAGARWSYAVLTSERVRALASAMSAHGHPLLYELDGLTVAISNVKHASDLDGVVLMLDEPGYLVAR